MNPGSGPGTAQNADVGSLEIRLTATDAAGVTASQSLNLQVGNSNDAPIVVNAIANVDATEDAVFVFAIPAGTFADPDVGDALSYSATLANGEPLPDWLAFNSTTGTFTGTPANADVGTLAVQVTATDRAGASIAAAFQIDVGNSNDAPELAFAAANRTAVEGQSLTFSLPHDMFRDADAGDTIVLSAVRPNGDALPAWLSFNAETQTFSGTPRNGDVGQLDIKIVATDRDGARGEGR